MPSRAPVLLFTYNRPRHAERTLAALAKDPLAAESDLILFSDGPRTPSDALLVEETRTILGTIRGFGSVEVVSSAENRGLAASIRAGVTLGLERTGQVIVMEDDLEIVPGFLAFMNQALEAYRDQPKVFSVSGWAPAIQPARLPAGDTYLSPRALCWGWATWADRWRKVDWDLRDYDQFSRDREAQRAFMAGGDDLPDMLRNSVTGRVKSWAVRWVYAQFRQGSFCVVPVRSFVTNEGFDGSGTNTRAKYPLPSAPLADAGWVPSLPAVPEPEPALCDAIRRYYGYNWKAKLRKLLGLL